MSSKIIYCDDELVMLIAKIKCLFSSEMHV